MPTVKILRHKGSAYIVEYTHADDPDKIPVQVILPAEDLVFQSSSEAFVDPDVLSLGIPVGIQWEYLLEDVRIPAKSIEKALLRNGIRTAEDYKNPNAVRGAVMEAATPILVMLERIIKSQSRHQEV